MIGSYVGAPIGGIINRDDGRVGVVAVTLGDATLAATATLETHAQATVVLDDAALTATAILDIAAAASVSLSDASLTAAGELDVVASGAIVLDDSVLAATGIMSVSASLAVTLDDASLVATALNDIGADATVTLDDATLFADSTLRLPQTGAYSPEPKRKKTSGKLSKRERERLLDQAIEKALEPPREVILDRTPWLIEPIPEPILLDVPEYNPVLAGLYDQAADLQSQLARLKFDRAQEDDDIELLLMALA